MPSLRVDNDLIVPEIETAPITCAADLEKYTLAVSVSFTWMGMRRTLDMSHRVEIAEAFHTEARRIGASKRLLDSKHPTIKALKRAKGKANKLWNNMTMPFAQDGIKLLRVELAEAFEVEMQEAKASILRAAHELQTIREEILLSEQESLQRLYNAADYPPDFSNQFNLEISYPNIQPDPRLEVVNAIAYHREVENAKKKFAKTQEQIEALMFQQLRDLVTGLATNLGGLDTGERKQLPHAATRNLQDFLARARTMNVSGNAELNDLMAEAERIMNGVDDVASLRQETVRAALTEDLQTALARINEVAVNYDVHAPARGRRVLRVKETASVPDEIPAEIPASVEVTNE